MRTPWRFISDLVSGKAPEDRAVKQLNTAPNAIAIEHKPASADKGEDPVATDLSFDQPETKDSITQAPEAEAVLETAVASQPDVSEHAVSVIETPPVTEENIGETETQLSEDVSVVDYVSEDAPVVSKPMEAQTPREKSSGQDVHSMAPASQPAKTTSEPAIVAKSLDDQMEELDEEIAELRRKLSEKLLIQNAQLKKMLARYGS
jgi:hypothetical protein